jgi:hypothetical protein
VLTLAVARAALLAPPARPLAVAFVLALDVVLAAHDVLISSHKCDSRMQ